MSPRVQLIRQVLCEALAPLVAAEGGLLYLTEIHEREITIHLAGRYAGNPGASLLHNEMALPLIDAVAPGTIVHWSSGRLIPRDAELLIAEPQSTSDETIVPAPSTPES